MKAPSKKTVLSSILATLRVALATIFFVGITLLFLDFTGTTHKWLGWMARVQLLPAAFALNVVALSVLVVVTLLFGRVYCSVVCPLGIMQDIASWFSGRRKQKKWRFRFAPARTLLRLCVLAFGIVALVTGVGSVVALLDPYGAYGRIAQNLFAPIWTALNNLAAIVEERLHSYAFYHKDVWIRAVPVFVLAVVSFVVIAVLAWRGGRTYCNTICPVGTILGFLAKFSFLKPVIDKTKCNGCGLCERGCKASCISSVEHSIDYSRCVACMNCLKNCKRGAISYVHPHNATKQAVQPAAPEQIDTARRGFLSGAAVVVAAGAVKDSQKRFDGGLATILAKRKIERDTPIVPPGAEGLRHLARHCTGCQLCVAVCPNGVLHPSTALSTLMQPEVSYERGYCRPECTKCSEVCPAGAIHKVTSAQKTSIQVGHAVWVRENCVVLRDGVKCGNCARHCPAGAIMMVASDENDFTAPKIPTVNTERCIGCGACENLCPARPFSAIYVEGHEVHRTI